MMSDSWEESGVEMSTSEEETRAIVSISWVKIGVVMDES